ncbi:MAG TPA: fused MFS/spermidine synthase [Bryobacteraceae bacterium]|nr:fused MFS/spermidine synthase [Bryobacteraceae bacterium]
MFIYALTIFLSAFLLFQVQPLIAKIILPWFGGSAAVWSAAMLFFQVSLLAGYAYAHSLIRHFRARAQMKVHSTMLAVSVIVLGTLFNYSYWKPEQATTVPTLRILMVLAVLIGLPYFLLSSTSPLLQAWYVRRSGTAMPYRLFALSNFGSMLGLITFPFLVEPNITSRHQAWSWGAIYVGFALLCGTAAWVSQGKAEEPRASVASFAKESAPGTGPGRRQEAAGSRPPVRELVLWVSLAACASVLLVSITNHLSQNVAPIPLLWVIPLALYLLSFILCFESDGGLGSILLGSGLSIGLAGFAWYFHLWELMTPGVKMAVIAALVAIALLVRWRWFYVASTAALLGFMAYYLYQDFGNTHIRILIPLFAGGLFFSCMLCHGELARRRPSAEHLTLFYLMVSLGGALGGTLVALVAPHLFKTYLELPIGMAACALLAVITLWDAIDHKIWVWPLRVALCVGLGALAGYLVRHEYEENKGYQLEARNFYGVLRVRDDDLSEADPERTLTHGTINHGSQLLNPDMRYVTTSYYGERSGIGRAIRAIQAKGPARIGSIGLGAGVLSNYGRKGDYLRIYEINPLVQGIAQTWFTFYPHSPADKKIVMGDARLSLEEQLKAGDIQNFDVLSVDAFSSDAIPIHLLTREAFDVYFHHLKPNGILALHISNRYLDLGPVCAAGADYFHKIARTIEDDASTASYFSSSTWVLVTSDESWFSTQQFSDATMSPTQLQPGLRPWTDDYSNIVQILRLK